MIRLENTPITLSIAMANVLVPESISIRLFLSSPPSMKNSNLQPLMTSAPVEKLIPTSLVSLLNSAGIVVVPTGKLVNLPPNGVGFPSIKLKAACKASHCPIFENKI